MSDKDALRAKAEKLAIIRYSRYPVPAKAEESTPYLAKVSGYIDGYLDRAAGIRIEGD